MSPIDETRAILGEGPVWYDGKLLWIDIEGRMLHYGDWSIDLAERIGFAWPCAHSSRLVCGLESGLVFLDPDTGGLEPIVDPEPALKRTRFNDGKCDPLGRIWAGTMDMQETEALGSLYMLGANAQLERRWQGVTVSNGLAWDPDGTTFYYIDSPTREVVAFDYNAPSGEISARRVVISIPDGEGFPDGMTIDCEGNLWIALWGGWGVVRYDPKTGERLGKIKFPVEKVTSCVFGGSDWDRLYVTTARIGLDDDALAAQPHAGGVFCCDVGVSGIPTVPFGYSAKV